MRRRRGCVPRNAEGHRGRETRDTRRKRLEHGERYCRREGRSRRTRFVPRRLRAAIVGGGLCDLGAGCVVLVMMKRARAVLAALPARFRRPLPAGTRDHRALRKRKHADDRRHALQD